MIELTISDQDPKQVQLKEQLEGMSLARRIIIERDQKEPKLKHDKEEFQGVEAIENYFVNLESFVHSWYNCRCDKYFEEN